MIDFEKIATASAVFVALEKVNSFAISDMAKESLRVAIGEIATRTVPNTDWGFGEAKNCLYKTGWHYSIQWVYGLFSVDDILEKNVVIRLWIGQMLSYPEYEQFSITNFTGIENSYWYKCVYPPHITKCGGNICGRVIALSDSHIDIAPQPFGYMPNGLTKVFPNDLKPFGKINLKVAEEYLVPE